MPYIGDYAEDYATLNHKFTTRTIAGVPATLANSPVVAVYKGSATGTEKTSAESYITLSVDFDSITGLNNILIDLSGDAFFETGQDYSVAITTGEVNSVSVIGETVFEFSIENRFGAAPLGTGNTSVNHDTGGADNLAYKENGTGIGGATVKAYLTSEFDASVFTLRGETRTDDNGQWVANLRLNSGSTYTIRFEKLGLFGPDTLEVTVP